jgi:hypothetical protein
MTSLAPKYASDQPVPTLQQVPHGEKPANTTLIRIEAALGSRVVHSPAFWTDPVHPLGVKRFELDGRKQEWDYGKTSRNLYGDITAPTRTASSSVTLTVNQSLSANQSEISPKE